MSFSIYNLPDLAKKASAISTGAFMLLFLSMNSCASLSYYSGSSSDKEQIRQVLLTHARSVVAGSKTAHLETQVEGAIHAGVFTGEHPGVTGIRNETDERVAEMSAPRLWVPPEREIVTRVRITRVSIKFLLDTVAQAAFREIGFDSMDREVYQHDVSAFLSKEGRKWLIYAMAGGNVVFDRDGLEKYWAPRDGEEPMPETIRP